MINERIVRESLKKVIEQKSGKDVIALGMISSIIIKGGNVGFALEISGNTQASEELRRSCEQAVKAIPGVGKVTVVATGQKQTVQQKTKLHIEGVKNIIVVASGKGGVGKSTVALNVALSLEKLKHKVALVDADIYGPSIPKMLGTETLKPEIQNGKALPIEKHGLHTISIGYFIDKDRAAIWRGPMITKALYNLLIGTRWSDVEYLIIDTPPGTGDVHLSLMENFNLTGAIIVSTPQGLALIDARKIYDMFTKLSVPVIGIVENMSYFTQNGLETYIFGKDGVKRMSEELGIKLLGRIPLDPQICHASDCGDPSMLSEDLAKFYKDIALETLCSCKILKKP
ncbi:Mrp/NBP35 family ATP-binding protein [Candidatus Wolbachia massiliensis]|uniref:Iron-sulfur cluster carrier protein n=1 Tax=Candidatus Wolbachia massiliensis TaxID=1845000 RepID=A0A7L7YM91_9RICK|nr:Mrp/NBP35 family ATP-binding protein [Candidatus Wolbachia massiliensis]QOD38178.1 Mrp/NBP35 family ATP-binding protein [Candidatus Wolbachia massiliensis]